MFVELVDKHISGSYLETGREYGRKLIAVSASNQDCEGIFTLRKRILEVMYEGRLSGFVVLTEKIGGSVKTGPTIIFDRYRGKGLGEQLRGVLHETLFMAGFRKVYCSAPARNIAALSYLLKSGYKVEAHLQRHYHQDHDEFIFGYMLARYRGEQREYTREMAPFSDYKRLTKYSESVCEFIREGFSEVYAKPPNGWEDC